MSINITKSRLVGGSEDALRDLDMLGDATKKNLNCDMVLVRVAQQNRFFSVGATVEDAGFEVDRVHDALRSISGATMNTDETVLVSDASTDERFRDLSGVSKGPIAGYLGVPLHGGEENSLGSVHAICWSPRDWNSDDVQSLRQLSRIASSLILKELQRMELASLHDSLQEADLVAMSLAREMTSLVSIHNSDADVLFSSMSLMRLAPEKSIAEVGLKLIRAHDPSKEMMPEHIAQPASIPNVTRESLRMRDNRKLEIDVCFTNPIEGIFFLQWSNLSAPTHH